MSAKETAFCLASVGEGGKNHGDDGIVTPRMYTSTQAHVYRDMYFRLRPSDSACIVLRRLRVVKLSLKGSRGVKPWARR